MRLKRHFANTYLSASKGGIRKPETKERLHAAVSLWFAGMVIPNFLKEYKLHWNSMLGTPKKKAFYVGVIKGCITLPQDNAMEGRELFEHFRNLYGYYEFICLFIQEIMQDCSVRKKKKETKKNAKAPPQKKVSMEAFETLASKVDEIHTMTKRLYEALQKKKADKLSARQKTIASNSKEMLAKQEAQLRALKNSRAETAPVDETSKDADAKATETKKKRKLSESPKPSKKKSKRSKSEVIPKEKNVNDAESNAKKKKEKDEIVDSKAKGHPKTGEVVKPQSSLIQSLEAAWDADNDEGESKESEYEEEENLSSERSADNLSDPSLSKSESSEESSFNSE